MSFFGTSGGGGSAAITDTYVVASQVAMLALSANHGDVAVRTDLNKTFILMGTDPTILGDWQELLTPTDSVTSVNGDTGTVVLDTSDISENTNLYFTEARVLGTDLAGFSSGFGTVAASDTILQAVNKLDGNIALKAPIDSPEFTTKVGVTLAGAQDANAALQVDSTTKGFLPPRMTSAQLALITSPTGLIAYNTDNNRLEQLESDGTWQNIAIGTPSAGFGVISIGKGANISASVGSSVFIGQNAGNASTASSNVMIGREAGSAAGATNRSTFIGFNAGKTYSGNQNIYIGSDSSARAGTTGADNVIVGGGNGASGTLGSFLRNIIIGRSAASSLTTGEGNVIIGYLAASSITTGGDNLIIGRSATIPDPTGSGQLNLIGMITGTSTDVTIAGSRTLTINNYSGSAFALVSDTSKRVVESAVTGAELALLSGKTALGDVVGPASSTDNAIARFDSTTGKLLQNSSATISDNGDLTINEGQLKFNESTWTTLPTTGSGTAPVMWIAGAAHGAVSPEYMRMDIFDGSTQVQGNHQHWQGSGSGTRSHYGHRITGTITGGTPSFKGYATGVSVACPATHDSYAGTGVFGTYISVGNSDTTDGSGVTAGLFAADNGGDLKIGLHAIVGPGTGYTTPRAFGIVSNVSTTNNASGYAAGFFRINSGDTTFNTTPTVNAALVASNGDSTDASLIIQDNTTTRMQVIDGGQAQFSDGSNSAPGISFISQTDMGLVREDSTTLTISVGGSARAKVKSSRFDILTALQVSGAITASASTLDIGSSGSSNGFRHVYVNQDLNFGTVGGGLKFLEGTNAKLGVATLVAGTVTVSNTAVTANSRIFLTHQNNSGTPGFVTISARTASTSFTITSSSNTDTSDIAWMIVEPA